MPVAEKYKRYSHYKSRLVASKSKKPPERRKDDLSSSTNASAPILMSSHANKERTAFGTPQKTRPQPATPQKARPPMSTPEKSRPEFATPRKIKPQFATPQKTKPQFATPQNPTATLAPFSPPESTTPIMSPAKLQEVGPTPQLSGKVLGILDSQSFSPFRTPIKAVTPNGLFGGVIKSSGGGLEDCPVISTPTSGSAKRKRDTNDENEIPETPHSNASSSPVSTPRRAVSRILPGTPKYFHQAATRVDSGINFSDTDSDSEEEFGGKGRLRAQRGLSSIIAELRENKYQQIDEEEDILREIENESYDPDMLGEVQGDEDELNPEHPEGFKVYKKKGQKRTTRRHISMYTTTYCLLTIPIYLLANMLNSASERSPITFLCGRS